MKSVLSIKVTLIVSIILIFNVSVFASASSQTQEDEEEILFVRGITYDYYLSQHVNALRPNDTVIVPLDDFSDIDMQYEVLDSFEGYTGTVLITDEEGFIEWEVNVPEEGLYNVSIEYFPIEGRGSAIEREIWINGEMPFRGANHILLSRVWADATGIIRDNRDNDIRPRQIERPVWRQEYFRNHMGYVVEPYLFFLREGINNIRLISVREPLAIKRLEFRQAPEVMPYEAIFEKYQEKGLTQVSGQFIKIQAETPILKSDPTLHAITDRTSPATIPYHWSKIRLNTIGGYRWAMPRQWIAWEVNIEEEGLYQIALRARQNIVRGLFSTRKLTINGQVPFKEMEEITFSYDNAWGMHVLGKNGEPFLFHLTEGSHVLELEAVLAQELAKILRVAEESVYTLNEVYRRIIMVTGAVPDPFRDHQLHHRMPDVLVTMREQSQIMRNLSEQLEDFTGQRSAHNAILERLAIQLEDMSVRHRTIPERLGNLRANIGGLGAWILTTREQPLEIDFLVVSSPEMPLPRADVGFFERLIHEARAFIASFTEDFDAIGDVHDEREAITVWIATGRDQAQILKQMIDDTFTPQTGIPVNLQLVMPGVLLPATVAGIAPDVAMSVFNGEPVNYATRNAVVDLSGFADFWEVAERFHENALIPYKFDGGVYALPEQQMFPMLFYRKDVLHELGLSIPDTWDELFQILPEIQKNHMEFGLPVSTTADTWGGMLSYGIKLKQLGGALYHDEGISSALDTDEGIEAFKRWTEMYVLHRLPLAFDLVNRFRTGEMPIAISDYWLYNVLQVFAPELRGMWGFAPIPGIRQTDGTINRSAPSGGTAIMMLEQTESQKRDGAWEFMKWWTDTDAQVRFAREMESIMGAAARFPTANMEALAHLPWPRDDYRDLMAQWEWSRPNPEVPGGYFTSRHLDNAFRAVVLRGADPRETLLDHIRIINEEIDAKRREFGLTLRPEAAEGR